MNVCDEFFELQFFIALELPSKSLSELFPFLKLQSIFSNFLLTLILHQLELYVGILIALELLLVLFHELLIFTQLLSISALQFQL
jgi:hypothetical protein